MRGVGQYYISIADTLNRLCFLEQFSDAALLPRLYIGITVTLLVFILKLTPAHPQLAHMVAAYEQEVGQRNQCQYGDHVQRCLPGRAKKQFRQTGRRRLDDAQHEFRRNAYCHPAQGSQQAEFDQEFSQLPYAPHREQALDRIAWMHSLEIRLDRVRGKDRAGLQDIGCNGHHHHREHERDQLRPQLAQQLSQPGREARPHMRPCACHGDHLPHLHGHGCRQPGSQRDERQHEHQQAGHADKIRTLGYLPLPPRLLHPVLGRLLGLVLVTLRHQGTPSTEGTWSIARANSRPINAGT